MKHILKYIYLFAFIFSVSFFAYSSNAFAASEELTLNYNRNSYGTISNYYASYISDSDDIKVISFDQDNITYYCIIDRSAGGNTYNTAWTSYTGPIRGPKIIGNVYFVNSDFSNISSNDPNFYFTGSTYYITADPFVFSGTATHFDNVDIAKEAVNLWDFSYTGIDWETEQDFNIYNPDTPLTDISNIQFNGFTINNPDNLDFDVIQKTTLFGLKWENGSIVPDHSNILYQSSFNGALAHISPTSNGFIDPDAFYGWGIKDAVIAAYDNYIDNVSVKDLPGYSWLNSFNGKLLPVKYIPDWFNNFYASFFENGCLSVTYYVRYNAAASVSGQWSKYMRTGKNISQTAISGGSIQNSFDEKTVQLIETTDGMQRPAVTATELGINTNEYDISDLKNTVSSFRDLVGDVPVLYASLFGFLPSWVGGWIALLISVGVVMSIYHLIRG